MLKGRLLDQDELSWKYNDEDFDDLLIMDTDEILEELKNGKESK